MRARDILSAKIACLFLSACTAASTDAVDDGDDTEESDQSAAVSAPPPDSGMSRLHLSPSREYSGFDGEHTFKVPVAVYGAKAGDDITVTPDEPGSAVVERVKLTDADPVAESGVYFMVDVKKAGSLKLTAKSGGQTSSATISVAAYEPARWETGRARYETAGANGDAACRSCHVDGRAIDHSPAALASVADLDVGRIMTLGVKSTRTPISTGCSDCSDAAKKHQWTLTDDERRGLTAYLRSLNPRGFE